MEFTDHDLDLHRDRDNIKGETERERILRGRQRERERLRRQVIKLSIYDLSIYVWWCTRARCGLCEG
jgi:hypothetical protein